MSADDLLAQLRAKGAANEAASPPADKPAEPAPEPAAPKSEAKAESGVDFLARMQAQSGAGDAVNPPAKTESAPAASSDEAPAEPNSNDLLASLMAKGADKSETTSETTSEPATTSEAAETTAEPGKPAKKKRTAKRKGSSFILAIDVAAVKGNGELGEAVHLSEFLQPITDYIAKEWKNKDHPDGIGHWGLIPFGEGKAYLARQVERYLDKHGFKGVLLVDSGTAEGAAVKDALIRRADVVFRAQR